MSIPGVLGRAQLRKQQTPFLDILKSMKDIMVKDPLCRCDDFDEKVEHLDLGISTMEHLIDLMPFPHDTIMVTLVFLCNKIIFKFLFLGAKDSSGCFVGLRAPR